MELAVHQVQVIRETRFPIKGMTLLTIRFPQGVLPKTGSTLRNSGCEFIIDGVVSRIKPQSKVMQSAAERSFMNATDAADYLVNKGIPFRSAYQIIGSTVQYCVDSSKYLNDLSLDEWQNFDKNFESDIIDMIKVSHCVDARDVIGGTSRKQVKKAIEFSEKRIGQYINQA